MMSKISLLRRGAIAALVLGCGAIAAPRGQAAAALPIASGGEFSVAVVSWRDLPFRTVVRQQFDYNCGSAALATLLRYHYGRTAIGEAEIFKAMYAVGDQAKIRKVGFSLLDMKRYLASAGYSADGYRLPFSQIELQGVPGIALIKTGSYKHFVVVKGVRGDRVLLGDPALGVKSLSRAEFEKVWSGIFFIINKSEDARFNTDAEWALLPRPLLNPYLSEQSTGALLRDMPTLYQITNIQVIR
jgi:predicted double-glycine peptidase